MGITPTRSTNFFSSWYRFPVSNKWHSSTLTLPNYKRASSNTVTPLTTTREEWMIRVRGSYAGVSKQGKAIASRLSLILALLSSPLLFPPFFVQLCSAALPLHQPDACTIHLPSPCPPKGQSEGCMQKKGRTTCENCGKVALFYFPRPSGVSKWLNNINETE
jgi:hypothetical protein